MVAARDLKENLSTKGFWIGLLMMPVMFALIGIVPSWLARQQPATTFFVMDRAGGNIDAIDRALQHGYLRAEMDALQGYFTRYAAEEEKAGEEKAGEAVKLYGRPSNGIGTGDISDTDVDRFITMGGVKGALARAEPYLVAGAPAFVPPRQRFVRLPLPDEMATADTPGAYVMAARPYLRGQKKAAGHADDKTVAAAVYIPESFGKNAAEPDARNIMMWANEGSREALSRLIGGALTDDLHARAFSAAGIPHDRVATIQNEHVDVTQYRVRNQAGAEGANQKVGLADIVRQWAPSVLCFLLFQALIFTVSLLLTNTIEEKSNRVIEILMSSMSPHELMIGKLLGCAAIGGMLIAVWLLLAAGFLSFASGPVKEIVGYAYTVLATSYLLPAFVIYFVMAYLMFSAIFLTIGSLCNTMREAQNLLAPIMILLIVPMMSIVIIPRNPGSTFAEVLSWIPIFTPIVMLARISSGPPVWEIVGTGILMIATAAFLLWGSGVIFKRAILRSGAPIRFRDIFALVSSDM